MYNQFTVEKCIIGTSGTYQNVHSRPYTMHCGGQSVDELITKTNGGNTITSQNVVLENNNIMQLRAEAGAMTKVSGGWDSCRNVFMMVIKCTNTQTKYIISGYTTPDFVQGENIINPNGVLTINSVVELQSINGPAGPTYRLVSGDMILSPTYIDGGGGHNPVNTGKTQPQRPSDVLEATANRVAAGIEIGESANVMSISDNWNDVVGGYQSSSFSRADNNSSNSYLSRTLNAINDTSTTNEGIELGDLFGESSVSSMVAENSYQSQSLLNSILSTNYNKSTSSIEWSGLVGELPNLNDTQNVTTVIRDSSGVTVNSSQSWAGRGEAVLASEFAAAVPGLMLKLAISSIGFEMTNNVVHNMDGSGVSFQLNQHPANPAQRHCMLMMDNLDEHSLVSSFIAHMRSVIFPNVAKGRQLTVRIECSFVKDLVIVMSVDGEVPVTFSAPTFASAAWSPTNAHSLNDITNMANGMLELNDALTNAKDGMIDNVVGDLSSMMSTTNQPINNFGF